MKPEALSLKECGVLLGVHWETIRREIKRGRLSAFTVGGHYRILRSELLAYTKRRLVITETPPTTAAGVQSAPLR